MTKPSNKREMTKTLLQRVKDLESRVGDLEKNQPYKYEFNTIFDLSIHNNICIAKYNILINGQYFKKGVIPLGNRSFGGLTFPTYFGREFAGHWNNETKTLEIIGFY